MTGSRHKSHRPTRPHFFTCTTIGQTPIFTRPDTTQKVLDSLRRLQEEGRLAIYGYVVLEDHVHLIASAEDLAKELGELKSSTAEGIIELLERLEVRSSLRQLRRHQAKQPLQAADRLWQESSQPQMIENREMMRQKLEYIHANPVKRGYVADPTLLRYSSARNYAGQPGLLPVTTDW